MTEPKRKRGRPPGPAAQTFPAETKARARAIFDESSHLADDAAISRQLALEGFGDVPATNIGVWRRHNKWAQTQAKARQVAELGEEMRQAVQVRVPDDLDRVEQASIRLARTGEHMAQTCEAASAHVRSQLADIEIGSTEELEVASRSIETLTRCSIDLLKTQLVVGKALQDLRLLRVSSAFSGDGPREGEVIPPDRKRERDPADPLTAQEAVLSNFAH